MGTGAGNHLLLDLLFWVSLPISGAGILAALLGLLVARPRAEWRALTGLIGALNIAQALWMGFFTVNSTAVALSILAGLACLVLVFAPQAELGTVVAASSRETGRAGS